MNENGINSGSDLEDPLIAGPSTRRVQFADTACPENTSSRKLLKIFNSNKGFRLNLERSNMGTEKLHTYYRDIFHTLVNMPTYRFLIVFVSTYMTMYAFYASIYMVQPKECISRVSKFTHALWFSVHTSATIGYGHMAPDPDCLGVNLGITCQVLTTCLMQATLLGLVYARFSSPSNRATTIKFSKSLAMYKGTDGHYKVAFRVANMRSHQVLRPEVRMLMLYHQQVEGNLMEHRYKELPLKHIGGGSLWLGVPSIMAHTIDQNSPLWGIHRSRLEEMDVEFVVLLDGVDETTSAAMQARHSYFASNIEWGMRFAGLLQRQAGTGGLAADYSCFDLTTLVHDDD